MYKDALSVINEVYKLKKAQPFLTKVFMNFKTAQLIEVYAFIIQNYKKQETGIESFIPSYVDANQIWGLDIYIDNTQDFIKVQ